MTNFDPTKLDWTVGLLAGWTYDKPVNKWFQGQFRHAHRLTRPCPTCTETIVLDVTTKALEGKAINHGLALRRCKKCRTALKAGPEAYAVRKAEVAPAVVASAPVQAAAIAAVTPSAQPTNNEEMERLRTANVTMKEELDGLYAQLKELRERLAQYEPDTVACNDDQFVVRTAQSVPIAATPKPVVYGKLAPLDGFKVAKPQDLAVQAASEELLQKWLTQNKAKMPWE